MTVRTEWIEAAAGADIAVVTIDRPERRNAVDHATLLAVRAAQVAASQRGVRAFVLTGAAPAFSAGADLGGVERGEFTDTLLEVLTGFGALPCVTIAAVDGPALGAGTQLAIACDVRVATAGSMFGIPAAKLGLAVDRWTVDRLTREFGWSIARSMLLTAATFDGAALASIGVVHRIGDLAVALDWAEEIARLAPLTVAAHKLALEQPDRPEDVDRARDRAWESADAAEGRTAFLEKRPARFRGE
jgi:enoyl-CoA hydratase